MRMSRGYEKAGPAIWMSFSDMDKGEMSHHPLLPTADRRAGPVPYLLQNSGNTVEPTLDMGFAGKTAQWCEYERAGLAICLPFSILGKGDMFSSILDPCHLLQAHELSLKS